MKTFHLLPTCLAAILWFWQREKSWSVSVAWRSKTATANLLKRMQTASLIDRVRRGHYAVRQLGVLGTPAAAEDVALSVGAALKGLSR